MAVSGADIVKFAQKFLGTPYVWGGNSLTSGIDCSGLVQQVYKNFGVNVSRTTFTQIGEGKAVGQNELQAGDMIFFDTDKGTKGPDHVGIYMGGGKFIHAPRPGKSVEIADMRSGYYQKLFMGGRRVSGIVGGGDASPGDTASDGVAPRLAPEELAASYGWAYGFLNSIPEVKALFEQAVEGTWSADMFQAKMRDSKWFQENSAAMRKAAMEKQTDPATYNAKIQAASIQIQMLASQMGAIIPGGQLNKIAEQAITTGLDEAGIKDVLGGYVTFTEKGTLNGQAGMFEKSMNEFAYQQGVDLDRQTTKNQAQLIARGLATEQDFKDQIVDQAISTYPGYAQQLQAGQTMMQIANPYIQIMSKDLEVPATQINLKDQMVRQALNGVDKQGKPVGMDQVSFRNLIRQDPRWAKTQGAGDSVMKAGLQVLKDMGLR